MEKLDFGKWVIIILIFEEESEWEACEILGFCNSKIALSTIEGL